MQDTGSSVNFPMREHGSFKGCIYLKNAGIPLSLSHDTIGLKNEQRQSIFSEGEFFFQNDML